MMSASGRLIRPQQSFVLFHIFPPIQINSGKGDFYNFLNTVEFTGGEHKIFGGRMLQGQPHTFHEIARIPPIALGS